MKSYGTLFILAFSMVAHSSASSPTSLSNFQNNYVCNNEKTMISNPLKVSDIQTAIRSTSGPVRVLSYGHSWNHFGCPDDSTSGLGITMTSLQGRDIAVDEAALTVTVDAAVKTIDLLNFLANYVTDQSPSGYTLLAFPWYVYQSIGGAVSTGTHGSSIRHASLSHQVVAFDVVLANGSLVSFKNQSDPLFKALRVSVGQLGIITRLTLKIVQDFPVKRTIRSLPSSSFLGLLDEAQMLYLANKSLPNWMDETEFFWNPQKDEWQMVSFQRGDDPDPSIRHLILQSFIPDSTTAYDTKAEFLLDCNATMNQLPMKGDSNFSLAHGANLSSSAQEYLSNLKAQMVTERKEQWANESLCSSNTAGCKWSTPPTRPLNPFYALNSSADILMDASIGGVGIIAANSTLEATESYLKEPLAYDILIKTIPYDQYEVAVPLSLVGSCFRSLIDLVREGPNDKGFRTAPLMRFIGEEDGLLSYTVDGPRAFLNIEDYLYYNSGGQINERLRAVMGLLRSPNCSGRLHWGKAGWPDDECWSGEDEYPQTWCDLGCAKQSLDPNNRFRDSTKGVWTWEGVDLVGCCSADGFDHQKCECKVKRDKELDSCPPSPYYSNR